MRAASLRLLVLTVPTIWALSPAIAEDACDFLSLPDAALRNGLVFYRTEEAPDRKWQAFSSFMDMRLVETQSVTFVYVVRTDESENRSGALVIKSGVYRKPNSTAQPGEDKILLVRKGRVTDPSCPNPPRFDNTTVSGKGYEDYHVYQAFDTPETRVEAPILDRFHIKYRNADNVCVATNDYRKSPGARDHNASQFSFNPTVVDDKSTGTGLQFVFGIRPAYAAQPQGVLQRQTEIKHYTTIDSLQCIRFNLTINGDERNFLRINDLEGRRKRPDPRRQMELRVEN